ncbi:hypothetical protein CLOHYLEM_05260 [[Clostridium] hylemonae DSM 15053]|uniref:Uncharacterized protein n=1 Tax=[Clostridium] hylemonae DSM 15053 TaxID=553973 RepID=C0BZL8_9FIRM|nr:hypothetical protein CLOHYLEM_05260 [[Clostridium] hylemonae DSM 15053]
MSYFATLSSIFVPLFSLCSDYGKSNPKIQHILHNYVKMYLLQHAINYTYGTVQVQ